jgi:hypothetical protein
MLDRAAGAARTHGSRAGLGGVGRLFYIPAFAGGIFGLLGGYLTDRLGRRRVLTYSILVYALRGVRLGLLDIDRDAARAALLRVRRRLRRVRRRGRMARGAVPEPKRREKVLGYTQAFSSLGGLLVAGQFSRGDVCGKPAGDRWARRRAECARGLALHADVGRDPGAAAHHHPAVPARVADLGSRRSGGHAEAARASRSCSLRAGLARARRAQGAPRRRWPGSGSTSRSSSAARRSARARRPGGHAARSRARAGRLPQGRPGARRRRRSRPPPRRAASGRAGRGRTAPRCS